MRPAPYRRVPSRAVPGFTRATTLMNRPPASRQGAFRSSCNGDPGVDVVKDKSKSRRHHAYDLCRRIVQLDKAADDISIAAEPRLPQAMADNGHNRRIRAVVILVDDSSEHRRDTKQWKEFGRDRLHTQSVASPAPVKIAARPDAHAATRSSVRLSRCQSSQVAGETELWLLLLRASYTITRFSPSGYGSGRSSS